MATKTTSSTSCPVPTGFLEVLEAEGYTPDEIRHALEEAPPRWCTPAPTGPRVFFDPGAALRAVRAMCKLRHTKTRRWKGAPFRPEAWQVIWIIAPAFGWRYRLDHPDAELAGTRVTRTVYVEIPRKNGKSSLVSALLLVLLAADGEAAPEVYTAATGSDQAKIIFDAAADMAAASPVLRRRGVQRLQRVLRYPPNSGILRALSRVAEAAHGLNVSGAAIDELHLHRRRDLFDAIDTGTGARDQPLIFVITTADEGDDHTIYAEQHGITRRLAEGVYSDPSHHGVIWAAAETDDPFDEAVIRAVNPGWGVTVTAEYLRRKAEKARNEPSFFNTYCRLHLNIRVRAESRLLSMDDWRHQDQVQLLDLARAARAPAFGALDLSATSDFTAFTVLLGPDEDRGPFDLVTCFWLPEERVEDLERLCRVPLRRWVKEGRIHTTPGNTVDYRQVRADIAELRARFPKLRRVGYDPWNANETVGELGDAGFEMVKIPQTAQYLSPATKLLETLTIEHRLRHGGDPVLTWMASSLDVTRDRKGNIVPVKPQRDRSSARIDGMATLVMALACWLRWGRRRPGENRRPRARSTG